MLKKILLVLVIALVGLAGLISSRPATFSVERSATLAAPADIPFTLVNDLHRWTEWSPWEKLDPDMKRKFTGATAGLDAVYEWAGNDKVGEGRMTIIESKPNERISTRLEFIKPFASTANNHFTFTAAGEGTTITWKMEGKNDFVGKAFSLFMNMDQMIGKDFEEGLANLKKAAEAEAKKRAEEKAAAEAAAAAAAPADAAPAEGQPAPGTATATP